MKTILDWERVNRKTHENKLSTENEIRNIKLKINEMKVKYNY